MAQILNMVTSGNGGGGGDSGIDWANHWDLPADRTTGVTPTFSFSELADGNYVFYFQVLNGNYNNNVVVYAPKTFCVNFKVQTTDGTRRTNGIIERVLDRDEYSFSTLGYSDGDNVSKGDSVRYQTRDGIDIITMSAEFMMCAIPSYSPALVENAIRWSNIKNIATEETITPTLHVDEIDEGTTIGTLQTGPMVTIDPPSFISSVNVNANANQWGVDFKNTRVMSGYGRYQSELRISMTSLATGEQFVAAVYIDNATNVTPVYKIKKAEGIFANAVVGSCGDGNLICVKFNFPSTMTEQRVTVSAAKVGARGDAPSIGSTYTEAPSNYVEFAQLSVGATITAQTLGAIEQYTGSTTSTYTYGYFYKAVGNVVTTPSSLTATETSGTGVSITVSDPDGLLNYLVQITGAAAATLKRYLGNPHWTWTYTLGDNTLTWAALGTSNIIDALQYFTLTPTPSDVVTWETSNWVDAGSSVQNGRWEQVNVQPSSGGGAVSSVIQLAVADWVNNEQTVSGISGVTANSNVIVAPAPASQTDYTTAGILCTAQGAGTLTFSCTTVPASAITVNVLSI